MKLQELDNLIAKLEGDIRRLSEELTAAKAFRPVLIKHEHGMEATPKPVHIQPPLNGVEEQGGYGSIGNSIKLAIFNGCPSEFSVYDIEKALADMHLNISRPSISQCLSRWKKDLKVKTPGVGRKPTIYSKEGSRLLKPMPKNIM